MVTTASNLGLVPRKRLGALLAERRENYGYSLEDMARRSIGQFSAAELASIESGEAHLDDAALEALSLLYEFNSTPPIPQRSRLIIASDEDLSALAGGFGDAEIDLVLVRYLALLYLLRNRPVGEELPLRGDDLAMLAEAFNLTMADVSQRLQTFMSDVERIGDQVERLRRRLVVPAAGLLVGPTPVGALVLVK